ncbi:MAG: tetratricopeptide repeat protein, partial [Opitutales bacterium]
MKPIPLLRLIFACSALVPALLWAQSPIEEAFARGNAALAAEETAAAIAAYEAALMHGSSANLHYNLGTAYAREAQWGRASLHFHKALALNPNHRDARAQLALVRSLAGFDWEERGPLERAATLVSVRSWSWLGAGGFWLVVLLWFLRPERGSLMNAAARVLGGAVALLALGALTFHHFSRHEGVVLETTNLRVAATPQSPTGAEVEAGRAAHILN